MARPLRIEFAGAVYHVTARGNERKKIFFVKRDYERFKEYLSFACERFGCFLHGYVLMSNHYHLILETPAGNLSKVMHYINGSYTTYVNARRRRRGHLLQGRYKAIVVDKDAYLLELSRYLHLNPVRAGMVAQPEEYPHSSYRCFVDGEIESFLSTDLVLSMMAGDPGVARQKYRVFVESAIGDELKSPFADVYGGTILGSESFIKDILRRLRGGLLESEEVSYRKKLGASVEVDLLLGLVCAYCNCLKQDLPRHCKARKMVVYLLKMHTPLGNREIGELLGGLSYSAVGKAMQRISVALAADEILMGEIENLEREMSDVKG